ncbi:hypothetical protein Hanom_Chr09g00868791 [Helianthus anomalus]
MPSSYPGRHMSFPRLEPSTSEKRWVSVANWAKPFIFIKRMSCFNSFYAKNMLYYLRLIVHEIL